MKIRIFDERHDLSDFLALFQLSFGQTMSKDYFDWKYIKNPFRMGEIPVIVAQENDRIVGVNGFLPGKMMIDGKIVNVLQSGDSAVHPEFRGKGIFTQILQFAIKEFQKYDYRIIHGFANEKSLPGFLKLEWEPIAEIVWHWKVLNPENVFKTVFNNYAIQKAGGLLSLILWHKFRVPKFQEPDSTIRFVDNVAILEKVFDEWKSETRICTVRDSKYLNWRFKSHPEKEYSFIVILVGGEIRGYFILSIEELKGMKRGSISDYLVVNDDPNTFRSLLIYSLNIFKDEGCAVVDTWAFMQKWAEEIMVDCGFISSRSIFIRRWFSNGCLIARPIDKQCSPYDLSRLKWYITPSDADTF